MAISEERANCKMRNATATRCTLAERLPAMILRTTASRKSATTVGTYYTVEEEELRGVLRTDD